MKRQITVLATIVLFSGLCFAEDLKKLSLDDVSKLGLTIEADSEIKTGGKSSVRITTKWPTVVCLAEVEGPDIENAKLVYKAKVRSELDGTAFLEMWTHVDGGQYFSKGMNDVVSRKTDWKTIQTPFLLKAGQKPEKVTLNIVINGKGTVWVDDIVLSKEPLK